MTLETVLRFWQASGPVDETAVGVNRPRL